MRRKRTSWLPASASKNHLSFLETSGTGNGQFSAPIYSCVVPSGSSTSRCICRYFSRNCLRSWLSVRPSPEETRSLSPPTTRAIAASSSLCTAAKSAVLAFSADENVSRLIDCPFNDCPFNDCPKDKVVQHANKRISCAPVIAVKSEYGTISDIFLVHFINLALS